jgi:hypothetical protein
MEMTKYNKEDCIPIAYLVLSLTSDAYLCNAFKILVHLDYPDLKGIVATDSVASSSWCFMNCPPAIGVLQHLGFITSINLKKSSFNKLNTTHHNKKVWH